MVGRNRFAIIILGTFALFGYLGYNLYQLQINEGNYYSARAESQYRLAGFLEPHRGLVYFSDNDGDLVPVAANKSYPVIFAVPKEIKDVSEAVKTIAPIIDMKEEKLEQMFSNNKSFYRLLVERATDEQVERVEAGGIGGIYIDEREFRSYPFGDLASHLIGFVGAVEKDNELAGRYGVERQFNDLLSGIPGEIDGGEISRPIQGEDLELTINQDIQARAEEILRRLVNKYEADGGSVIVQNPKTGDIIAMGSYPIFDPNEYSRYEVGSFLNPVIQKVYEPGSIFKVITMSIGLDVEKVVPETTFNDTGYLDLNGKVIRNWDLKAHGKVTMTEVIEQSINTGSAFVAKQVGRDDFHDYLKKFGFSRLTGIQLPGEVVGSIENIKKQEDINLATASFGQGISVSPISLINAISAIANGGLLMKPNIVASDKPEEQERVISEKTTKQITEMMVSAVDKARVARVSNFKVAGKTGTGQVPDFVKGGYSNEVINTYIGFAPASDPIFTAMIKLDKPEGAPLAGRTVVPAFRELAEFILNYYNASPDNLPE